MSRTDKDSRDATEGDEVGSVRRRMSLTELDSRDKVFPLHEKFARFIGNALIVFLNGSL